MNRFRTFTLLVALAATTTASLTSADSTLVDSGIFPAGQPIVMASEDGSTLYAVVGLFESPLWGYALYVSPNAGATWSKTYDQVWSQAFTEVDAAYWNGGVYVAQIHHVNSGGIDYAELTAYRFDANGDRDASFGGGIGSVSISGFTTDSISDVSLVAGDGYLDVFWISESRLRHSYLFLPTASTGAYHSEIGEIVAYGGLDSAAMNGTNADLFAAFKGVGGLLQGWRWEFGGTKTLIDIAQGIFVFPQWETVTVSAWEDRVSVSVASPYDEDPSHIYVCTSDDDAVTWYIDYVATGIGDYDSAVRSASVVTGPGQRLVSFMLRNTDSGDNFWITRSLAHGMVDWTDTSYQNIYSDFIGTSLGMTWSPVGGYLAVSYSNHPDPSSVHFERLAQILRAGFEEGDLGNWSVVIGN